MRDTFIMNGIVFMMLGCGASLHSWDIFAPQKEICKYDSISFWCNNSIGDSLKLMTNFICVKVSFKSFCNLCCFCLGSIMDKSLTHLFVWIETFKFCKFNWCCQSSIYMTSVAITYTYICWFFNYKIVWHLYVILAPREDILLWGRTE